MVLRVKIVFSKSGEHNRRLPARPGDINLVNSRLPDWITLLQISGGAPVWSRSRVILRFGIRLEKQRMMMYQLSQLVPHVEEIRAVIREHFDLGPDDEIDISPT